MEGEESDIDGSEKDSHRKLKEKRKVREKEKKQKIEQVRYSIKEGKRGCG